MRNGQDAAMIRFGLFWLSIVLLCGVDSLWAQDKLPDPPDDAPKPARTVEEGFPVTDPLVIAKCGGCHQRDEKGNLSRISWERSTPEGWAEAIKRMVRLNGLEITPAEAHSVVKYLATYHGLAPGEAAPVMYMPEHRNLDETNMPSEELRQTCAMCHAFGKALSWRRSRDDWMQLENLHAALYETAADAFHHAPGSHVRPGTLTDATTPAKKQPEPGEIALDFLAAHAPLHSAEWAAWQSRIRPPRLVGTWLISASAPGHGRYAGELTVTAGATDDEFKTQVSLHSLKDGTAIQRSGTGLVYAGYSWRGRSEGTSATSDQPDDPQHEARETLWFSPDQSSARGRWYWGEYQEFGFDVSLRRLSDGPTVIALNPDAIKAGSDGIQLRILGAHFPANLTKSDLDLGSGVTIDRLVSHDDSQLVLDVSVASNALSGKRDIGVRGAILESALSIYHRVDYIAVNPETAIARLGSASHPKGYQQLEAVGYENGPDGKPHTADDLRIGPLEVAWSVEEFMSVYGDDDKEFVGQLSSTGLFTPASDGPNPKRKFSRNNYGNVWVVATAKSERDKDGTPLSGRSYLVVSVPTFIRWDQPEVSGATAWRTAQ